MEANSKKSWKIWLYLIPIFAIAAIPAVKWSIKAGSSDVPLSKAEYNAFNAEEGEIDKARKNDLPRPKLNDGEFRIHYKNAGERAEAEEAARREAEAGKKAAGAQARADAERSTTGRQAGAGNAGEFAMDSMKANEQRSVGLAKGYLSYAMGKVINNPKALGALLNNKHVINGFMSRDTVKNATASPEALADFLKNGSAIGNFMNNSAVQSALNNPAALSAAAGSGFMTALINTPAGQALLNDPLAMANVITANPQLIGLMSDPKIMELLMNNPGAAAYIAQMNLGGRK